MTNNNPPNASSPANTLFTAGFRRMAIAQMVIKMTPPMSGPILIKSSAVIGAPPARRLARISVIQPIRESTALPAQLRPVIQPPANLALEAAIGRIVKSLSAKGVREIVLSGKGLRRVVIVFVTAAIAFRLHQPGR